MGAGCFAFDNSRLEAFRNAVDGAEGMRLSKLIAEFRKGKKE